MAASKTGQIPPSPPPLGQTQRENALPRGGGAIIPGGGGSSGGGGGNDDAQHDDTDHDNDKNNDGGIDEINALAVVEPDGKDDVQIVSITAPLVFGQDSHFANNDTNNTSNTNNNNNGGQGRDTNATGNAGVDANRLQTRLVARVAARRPDTSCNGGRPQGCCCCFGLFCRPTGCVVDYRGTHVLVAAPRRPHQDAILGRARGRQLRGHDALWDPRFLCLSHVFAAVFFVFFFSFAFVATAFFPPAAIQPRASIPAARKGRPPQSRHAIAATDIIARQGALVGCIQPVQSALSPPPTPPPSSPFTPASPPQSSKCNGCRVGSAPQGLLE
ncbi:hypothetical protein AAL_04068 [Moelleriella libera RCEF 2490]|uniref:Uncharacterized protein n=1 Tax=Moelleriella libera RCEF 2490 TaxID=1081109 RepID=A0A168CNX4_9HYPO|nr:hypothetical protein AAL_04068 [Moelleriella libera RCEF 2490]